MYSYKSYNFVKESTDVQFAKCPIVFGSPGPAGTGPDFRVTLFKAHTFGVAMAPTDGIWTALGIM